MSVETYRNWRRKGVGCVLSVNESVLYFNIWINIFDAPAADLAPASRRVDLERDQFSACGSRQQTDLRGAGDRVFDQYYRLFFSTQTREGSLAKVQLFDTLADFGRESRQRYGACQHRGPHRPIALQDSRDKLAAVQGPEEIPDLAPLDRGNRITRPVEGDRTLCYLACCRSPRGRGRSAGSKMEQRFRRKAKSLILPRVRSSAGWSSGFLTEGRGTVLAPDESSALGFFAATFRLLSSRFRLNRSRRG
jgi:hypothetical protein